MTQKICPRCDHENALDNDFCGRCGTELNTALVPIVGKNSRLPAPLVRQATRAAAASLLALAAEVGLNWLRRRSEPETSPTIVRPTPIQKQKKKQVPGPRRSGVTVFSRRVVQVWERGRLRGQGVEESVWQWHEEI